VTSQVYADAPKRLIWRITERCDLDCRHCGKHGDAASSEVLDIDAMRDIADQIVELEPGLVVFSGGEPLLRSDFRDIASYLLGLDVRAPLVVPALHANSQHRQPPE